MPVPLPPVTANIDAKLAWANDEFALNKANGRLRAGRNCVVDLRSGYAKAR